MLLNDSRSALATEQQCYLQDPAKDRQQIHGQQLPAIILRPDKDLEHLHNV